MNKTSLGYPFDQFTFPLLTYSVAVLVAILLSGQCALPKHSIRMFDVNYSMNCFGPPRWSFCPCWVKDLDDWLLSSAWTATFKHVLLFSLISQVWCELFLLLSSFINLACNYGFYLIFRASIFWKLMVKVPRIVTCHVIRSLVQDALE